MCVHAQAFLTPCFTVSACLQCWTGSTHKCTWEIKHSCIMRCICNTTKWCTVLLQLLPALDVEVPQGKQIHSVWRTQEVVRESWDLEVSTFDNFFLRVAGFKLSTMRFHISLLLECRNSNDNTKPIWSITYVKLNQKVSQSTVQRDSMSTRLRNNQIDISTAVVSFDRTTVSIIKVISPPVALDPMISIKFSCIKRVVLPNEFWMQCMKCSVHGVPLNGLVQWRK